MLAKRRKKRERTSADACRYTPNTTEWVALNRSPVNRVNKILNKSRHAKHTLGRPHSAQASFRDHSSGDRRKKFSHLEGSQVGWGVRRPEKRGFGKKSVIDTNTRSGGDGGVYYARSPCKESCGDGDRMFPDWLLREMEFRQLASAEPSTLERRREEAATWIKQEVGASPSVMFGKDMPWYANGISNQHCREFSDRHNRQQQRTEPVQNARDSHSLGEGGRSTLASVGLPRHPLSRDGRKFLPNSAPPAYRAGGGVKKSTNPTGSGWEFTVSRLVLNSTGRASQALVAVGSRSGINLLDRFDDSMVDYLSAEVLLQQAFSIRSEAFGVDHPRARASALRLLQVYDAQQGGREEEAKELRADPQAHLRTVRLRIAELERAVGTFKMDGGGSSRRSSGDLADVEKRLANLFKEKWALAAAERARQRIRKRNVGEGGSIKRNPQAEAIIDHHGGEPVQGDPIENIGKDAPTVASRGQHRAAEAWHTTARHDAEGLTAARKTASDSGFDSEEAVRRATDSLQRHDYFLAARSCMDSLWQDVRNPAAIQVLQESFRQISSFPKKEDFRAEVEVSLGPSARGVLGERFTVRYSYRHRDKPYHPHPAKDWVGLFVLVDQSDAKSDAAASTSTTDKGKGPHHHFVHSPVDQTAYLSDGASSRQPTKRSATITTGEEASTSSGSDGYHGPTRAMGAGEAASAAAGRVGGSLTSPAQAAVVASAGGDPTGASGTNKGNNGTGSEYGDGCGEGSNDHTVAKSENRRCFRSSQVAMEFLRETGRKSCQTGEEGNKTSKETIARKLVGWRTLPRENTGLVAVDEGIVTFEGAYVVRYFLGGSGCWIAESQPFEVEMARVDLKIIATDLPAVVTPTTMPAQAYGVVAVDLPTRSCLRLECGAPFEVKYQFNYNTAVPAGDWLGVVAWGDDPTARACIVKRPLLESSAGTVLFEEGPSLPGKYAVHAFLTESDDAVVGSTAMFECTSGFDAENAIRARRQREFTLYLSTRWDMCLERAAFRASAAPALKQMLDARGVAFGYSDVRSDLSVEELNTPRGVETILEGIKRCRPYLVCCLGELNDVELGAQSVNASILEGNPWLKNILRKSTADGTKTCDGHLQPAAGLLTVTDLEVLSAFLLPVLQEAIEVESGHDPAVNGGQARLAAVPGGAVGHACIVNALADFRALKCREGEDEPGGKEDGTEGGGSVGQGVGNDRTAIAGLAFQSPVVPRRGFMTEHAFFYTRAACLRSELHHTQRMNAGGIAGVIRFINGSKGRMTQLKHEVAASTSRFRQGYQDGEVFLSMVLEDLSRAIDALYPLRTSPDRLDDGFLFPHAIARSLLEAAVVKLPVVRYRGFRPEPPAATGGASATSGLASVSAAALIASPTAATAGAAAAAAAAAAESAAWRLQQRLEFIQFEERVKRVSREEPRVAGDADSRAAAAAAAAPTAAFEGLSRGAMAVAEGSGSGDIVASLERSDGYGASSISRPAQLDAIDTGGDVAGGTKVHHGGVGLDAASAATEAGATAKRLVVVLAEYLENKTTIGMVVVDQPGTGLTTAMLGFMEWYCRGEAAGGRQGVAVVEALDSIPQYGRCGLSRAVVTRPRLVARDLKDGGLVHETVERRTLVLRVDCRDPCYRRLDKARLVHYLSCEIIRTFGMPHKMPDRPDLARRSMAGMLGDQPSVHDHDHDQDHDHDHDHDLGHEGVIDTQEHPPAAAGGGGDGLTTATDSTAELSASARSGGGHGGGDGSGGGGNVVAAAAAAATPIATASGGTGGKMGGRVEIGPDVLGRWLDLLCGYGDLVLIIENADALRCLEERTAGSAEKDPNPLAWLLPELPPHVKVITTCYPGSSCHQLLCGAEGWGWHMLRRKSGLDAEAKGQVIDAVLRRHGVGCMLDWILSDLVLKEKTTNIQFLVAATEALCCSGVLARSGLPPGLHRAAGIGSRPTSPSSVTSAAAALEIPPTAYSRANDAAAKGGGCVSNGMDDAHVALLREVAASLMEEKSALGIARLRIRRLVSVKGRRGSLLRAALCLVRLSHGGLSPYELSAALRHVLECYTSQRPQHNKQPSPSASPTPTPGGMTTKRSMSSKKLGSNGTTSNAACSQPANTAPTAATASEPFPSSSAAAAPRAETSAGSTVVGAASAVATGGVDDLVVAHVKASRDPVAVTETSSLIPKAAATATSAAASAGAATIDQPPPPTLTVPEGKTLDTEAAETTGLTDTVDGGQQGRKVAFAESREGPRKVAGGGSAGVSHTPSAAGAGQVSTSTGGGIVGRESSGSAANAQVKHHSPGRGEKAADRGSGEGYERVSRPAFAEQDWVLLEPDVMQFCYKALGRLVLRNALTIAAVDHELIHHDPDLPDKFVTRAQQHQNQQHQQQQQQSHSPISGYEAGAPAASGSCGGRGPAEEKVAFFYSHVLADSFAKDLPGVRRAEEELAALAAIITIFTNSGVDAPRRASRPYREKLFVALADVELLYAMNGSKRGDPQAYLEYMHLAQVFAAPRRFAAAVRSTFETYYSVHPHDAAAVHGRQRHHHHHGRAAAAYDLLYTVDGIKHPAAANGLIGIQTSKISGGRGREGGAGGGIGGTARSGLSEVSKVLASRRGQKPPPPPPLTQAGALRLLEAARLALERLGDCEESMNLAESAWALMFGVKELTDEAFERIADVSFPVDKVVDCLRLLAGVYVSRGLDMHLLLFHEAAQTDSVNDNNSNHSSSVNNLNNGASTKRSKAEETASPASNGGRAASASSLNPVTASGKKDNDDAHGDNDSSLLGDPNRVVGQRLSMVDEAAGNDGGGSGTGEGSVVSVAQTSTVTAAVRATTGRSGKFATARRVQEFRSVLKGAAAHASKMKVAHAKRELNIEGAVRGHDVDAAALNKSTSPGKQSKQQIGRVARAREAVDNMLKRWPVVIERMGICTEQAIKIRNLVKSASVSAVGGVGGGKEGGTAANSTGLRGHAPPAETRACEKLRAARDHARLVEQHAEILLLSLRFERVALAIQRRQEEREYQRQAALGLVAPGVSMSDFRDHFRPTGDFEDHRPRDSHGK